jgi:choline dehydrogenase-like flavoprotein
MTMAAPDVIIIGSDMGCATIAAAIAPTGRRILILERGNDNSARRHGGLVPAAGWGQPADIGEAVAPLVTGALACGAVIAVDGGPVAGEIVALTHATLANSGGADLCDDA